MLLSTVTDGRSCFTALRTIDLAGGSGAVGGQVIQTHPRATPGDSSSESRKMWDAAPHPRFPAFTSPAFSIQRNIQENEFHRPADQADLVDRCTVHQGLAYS